MSYIGGTFRSQSNACSEDESAVSSKAMISFRTLAILATSHLIGSAIARANNTASNLKHPVQWGPCDPSLVTNPALTCSFLEVPLDYHNRHLGLAKLAIARVNATRERRGTVFLLPGGPGGSGIDQLNESGDLLVSLTGGYYDIVGWDPRGVGALTVPGEIYCFDSPTEYNTFWNGTIELNGIEQTGNFTDPEEIKTLLMQAPVMQRKYAELARRCLRHPSGKYLKYVGTAATARDIVAMADALDGVGSPVNFVGFSYSSLLGSWLANMFPERVGKIIIDGVLNPTLMATEETSTMWTQHHLVDTDKVYEGFLTGCALAGPEGCPIATSKNQTAADLDAVVQALIVQAHAAARKNASAPVTSATIRRQCLALLSLMYEPGGDASFANTTWPQLVAGVQGESSALSRRVSTSEQNQTRSYTSVAILCGDSVDPRGTHMSEVFEEIVAASHNVSKMFSSAWPASFYSCPFWPVRAVERYQGPFNKTLANKIMVVSNTLDPVTPLAGAKAVVALLGDSARLVQQHGFGHTSNAEPSQCLNEVMFAYMTNNTLPEDNDTVCEVDADFEVFPGVNTEAILKVMGA
ncbi:TAP-like protein-domain-containing protein [Trametes gibbosa]|nr:TAP-like protein-domain-containing protein [Trametes gibbosa]